MTGFFWHLRLLLVSTPFHLFPSLLFQQYVTLFMHPLQHAQVYHLPLGAFWLDKDGILNVMPVKKEIRTLEDTEATVKELKKILGNKKVGVLVDVSNATNTTREMRKYASEEFPRLAKAIALVSTSALGKMFANLFFALSRQPYPIKMFNNEDDARSWLKQYL